VGELVSGGLIPLGGEGDQYDCVETARCPLACRRVGKALGGGNGGVPQVMKKSLGALSLTLLKIKQEEYQIKARGRKGKGCPSQEIQCRG